MKRPKQNQFKSCCGSVCHVTNDGKFQRDFAINGHSGNHNVGDRRGSSPTLGSGRYALDSLAFWKGTNSKTD